MANPNRPEGAALFEAHYWAEIDSATKIVRRVLVLGSSDPTWLVQNLGGTAYPDMSGGATGGFWFETFQGGQPPVKYAGKGYGFDHRYGEKFAAPWAPKPSGEGFDSGDVTFHGVTMWRSAKGANTSVPGTNSDWRDNP